MNVPDGVVRPPYCPTCASEHDWETTEFGGLCDPDTHPAAIAFDVTPTGVTRVADGVTLTEYRCSLGHVFLNDR